MLQREPLETMVVEVDAGYSIAVPDCEIVNINEASAAELQALPSITSKITSKIVAHREKNKPFPTAVNIISMHGIGRKDSPKDS